MRSNNFRLPLHKVKQIKDRKGNNYKGTKRNCLVNKPKGNIRDRIRWDSIERGVLWEGNRPYTSTKWDKR